VLYGFIVSIHDEAGRLFFKPNRLFLQIIALFVLLIIVVAVASSVWPNQEECFIELGLLGKNKTADEYFSYADAALEVNAELNWYIYVHNHMGRMSNLSIRIKLINATTQLPNDQLHLPSSAPVLVALPLSLSVNETALIPFIWRITEVEIKNDFLIIKRLVVNSTSVETEVSAAVNSSFWMVFEVWIQNEVSEEYQYGWILDEGFSSTSLYIGFNLSSTEE